MALISRRANGADFFVVVDETGRIVAQGSKELCDDVAANGPAMMERTGDFFEHRTVPRPPGS